MGRTQRLVIGWAQGEDGKVRPLLDNAPELEEWTRGALMYRESREQAEALVTEFEKAARGEVRRHNSRRVSSTQRLNLT